MDNFKKINIERKEDLSVKAETVDTDTLIDLIYKGQNLPQDNRFLSVEEGGVFKYFDLKHIQDHKNDKFYPIIKSENKIVGLSELLKDPFLKNNLWIQFISVDENEQGKGYASKLAREIFDFAEQNGYSLEASHYTEDGFLKLRPVFEKLANEYSNVSFINKNKL